MDSVISPHFGLLRPDRIYTSLFIFETAYLWLCGRLFLAGRLLLLLSLSPTMGAFRQQIWLFPRPTQAKAVKLYSLSDWAPSPKTLYKGICPYLSSSLTIFMSQIVLHGGNPAKYFLSSLSDAFLSDSFLIAEGKSGECQERSRRATLRGEPPSYRALVIRGLCGVADIESRS